MKIALLISIVIASIGLIFAGRMLFWQTPAADTVDVVAQSVVSEPSVVQEAVSGTSSLANLLARAENLECAITYAAPGLESEPIIGTYFTTKGKVRGDFIVSGDGGGIVSSIILTDDTVYSWSVIEGETYGVRSDRLTWLTERGNSGNITLSEPIDFDSVVAYECAPWSAVDVSIFEPPHEVLFRDHTTVLEAGMEYGTTYEDPAVPEILPCDLCKQVAPGEGQDECFARFQCT
jgi:hypothetical protein